MPVDQSGENILFIKDSTRIEVHIQIQYEGDAERFGWIIPLQAVPEFAVGSETLFQNLLNGSVPTYGITTQPDDCSLPDDANGGFDSASAGTGAASSGDGGGTGGGEPPGPDILLQETVGAYDITVLQGSNVDEVVTWLQDNAYQTDPEAEPILAEYIAEGHLFGAVKLTSGADVDEIHPIALSFDGTAPCVPRRLTRVAAVEDMDVRTFFLGDSRTVPMNYKHVLVNPLKIDWPNQATNYKEVISMAVDADQANGRAFVTEYAGPSNVVSEAGIHSDQWNASVFATIEPVDVITELTNQGLYFCDLEFGNGCGPVHPLVDPILAEYLPVPAGLTADEFYGDLAAYADQIDLTAWDGAAFADALTNRIIEPGMHAVDLLRRNPYLTRMYTTISPEEMTEDPEFHENSELEEVQNVRTATNRILCNGDSVWILPDGREVYVPQGESWPDFDVTPWEAEVQETPANGAPMSLVNNNAIIDEELAKWNAEHGWDGSGSGPGDGGGIDDSGGCGCNVASPLGSAMWAFGGAFGFVVVARRRRRR